MWEIWNGQTFSHHLKTKSSNIIGSQKNKRKVFPTKEPWSPKANKLKTGAPSKIILNNKTWPNIDPQNKAKSQTSKQNQGYNQQKQWESHEKTPQQRHCSIAAIGAFAFLRMSFPLQWPYATPCRHATLSFILRVSMPYHHTSGKWRFKMVK